ncbi:MAG TPA: hypothetical protein ENK11_01435 [Phycisphaerales bacterium]|nr:hypothetical protein [Phycisphaerales bacterium]
MVADTNAHQKLILALEHLEQGDSAGFEDTLWLAFGDHWTKVLQRLMQRRIVVYHAIDDVYSMSEAGLEALEQLRRESDGQTSDSPLSA